MVIKCKHCGSDGGYYVKEQFRGTCEVYYNADGTFSQDGSNGSMYDNAMHTGGKLAYCVDCRKSMGRSENLKKT